MNQFDFVEDAFDSGYPIAVMKNKLWGIISKDEKVLIPPKYDYIRKFVNGFAAVRKNEVWGFINEFGKEIIEPKYISVENFTIEGIAIVASSVGGYNIVDKNGNELLPTSCSDIQATQTSIVFVKDGFGFLHVYDTNTKNLKKLQRIYHFKPLNNYYLINNNESLVGLLNADGDSVIECKFDSITPLNEWLYAAYDPAGDCFIYNAHTNSLNYVGAVIIEDLVLLGDEFYLTFFDKDDKIHFIDTTNYMIVLNKYCDKIIENVFGTLKVELNGKIGYLYL